MSLFEELAGHCSDLLNTKRSIKHSQDQLQELSPPSPFNKSLSEKEYASAENAQAYYQSSKKQIESKIEDLKNPYNTSFDLLMKSSALKNQWLDLNPQIQLKINDTSIEIFQGDASLLQNYLLAISQKENPFRNKYMKINRLT